MKQLQFRMAAYTDAAGKYNPDAERNGNEDSFYVDDNLEDEIACHCITDEVTVLSECGMLMAIADGMGGMNAGEVASEIAIATVEDYFGPGKITPEMAATHEARKEYLEKTIIEADKRIKEKAIQNPEHEGMGSTIIMAWMAGNEVTISWCGDSRAYRFNPETGIEPLSEDHSYVQDLVRQGKLTYEATFGHPNGNIVTRSLGDPEKTAKPESRCFKVYQSDIIFLCSDGLSGVLRDKKTKDHRGNYYPGENLEDIIRTNHSTLTKCREALWAAAERADWYDNVTLVMCEVLEGTPMVVCRQENHKEIEKALPKSFWDKTIEIKINRLGMISLLFAFLFFFLVGGSVTLWKYKGHFFFSKGTVHIEPTDPNSTSKDTVITDVDTITNGDSKGSNSLSTQNSNDRIGDSSGSTSEPSTMKDKNVVSKDKELTLIFDTAQYIVKSGDTLVGIKINQDIDALTNIKKADLKTPATEGIKVEDTLY